MVSSVPRTLVTYEAYASGEASSEVKHEFVRGEIFAMAGGTPKHAALTAAMTMLLGAQLRGKPCRPYSSDLRVRIRSADVGAYPDITVICGEPERAPEDTASVLNPTLIVEVLSTSTEAYDRGDKFAHYRQVPSLKEYILVSQHKQAIERHVRNQDGSWTMTAFGPDAHLTLTAIGCELSVNDVYEGIQLR